MCYSSWKGPHQTVDKEIPCSRYCTGNSLLSKGILLPRYLLCYVRKRRSPIQVRGRPLIIWGGERDENRKKNWLRRSPGNWNWRLADKKNWFGKNLHHAPGTPISWNQGHTNLKVLGPIAWHLYSMVLHRGPCHTNFYWFLQLASWYRHLCPLPPHEICLQNVSGTGCHLAFTPLAPSMHHVYMFMQG